MLENTELLADCKDKVLP